MSPAVNVVSTEFDRATKVALAIQLPTAAVALILLDHGQFARLYGSLLIGFWIGAGMIATRRPFSPTRADLSYIRWGTIPFLAAAIVLRGMLG